MLDPQLPLEEMLKMIPTQRLGTPEEPETYVTQWQDLEAGVDSKAPLSEHYDQEVIDLYAGHTGLPLGQARLQPFLRLENVFNATYNGSVVVNAFGGRFFEPAPGRSLQAGVNLAF